MSSLSSTADCPDGRVEPGTVRAAGVRLKLFVGQSAIGVGQIDLLQRIGHTGSLRQAAAEMTMDEDRAAGLLKLMSDGFATPLVRPALARDKELELTELGAELIRRYHDQDRRIQKSSSDLKAWLTEHQAV